MSSANFQHDFLDPPDPNNGSADYLGTLGHYRVIKQLGKGGMGFVFLAEDTRLKREVALKVMNQKIAATAGSRKRFISEARAMAAVHHDNVATIFEVGEYKGTPFMAMELLEGSTLESVNERNERPDYSEVIQYAREMARGLGAAHAQGIVHRDIKPANIWLDAKTNRVKILDFGLALASTPVDQLSGRGAVVGTPGYLSPEQARSEPLDDRSDLYSTGVVLYELATGKLPLKTKSVAEQLIAILAHDPKPIQKRNPKIPGPLAELIHRLMAKEPRDRFLSAKQLEERLDEVEVECESKTEMAQAINQLQMGLQQVVNKKDSGVEEFAAPAPAQEMPNPFETLPESLPPAAPAAGAAVSASAAMPAADPLASSGTTPSPAFGARQPATAQPAKAAATATTGNWIAIGGIAVAALVVIPLAVFFGTSGSLDKQGQQAAEYVRPDVTSAKSSNKNNSNAAKPSGNKKNNAGTPKPRPKSNAQTPSGSGNSLLYDSSLTLVDAKKPTGQMNAGGAKWILNNKQGNGAFNRGQPTKDPTKKIPGWSVERNGPDAGWTQMNDSYLAYVGANSEMKLIGTPLNFTTQAQDTFRLMVNIGGEGQGMTEYQMVLGFRGSNGDTNRYQLARVTDGAKWNSEKPKRIRYQYVASPADAGKKPFFQLTISNKNRARTKAYAGRAVMTVARSGGAPANTASSTPKSTSPKPTPKPPAPKPPQMPNRTASASPSAATPSNTPAPGSRGNPKPQRDESLQEFVLATDDDRGADATVKRGSSMLDALGGNGRLAVQTRNGKELQHTYLRFNLAAARGPNQQQGNSNRSGSSNQNQRKPKKLDVRSAKLELHLSARRPADATLQVFGLNDRVSDIWPEAKIVWSNSLSSKGPLLLPTLADETLGPGGSKVVIETEELASFLSEVEQATVTLILTGTNGNEPLNFAAKEDGRLPPPTLTLKVTE